MILLLDEMMFKGILRITTSILQNYFFYDHDSLERFFQLFTDNMIHEYGNWIVDADEGIKTQLRYDNEARKDFTCFFVSYHLHDILVQDLHFTDMELNQFENILPKYSGAKTIHAKQRDKRAYY